MVSDFHRDDQSSSWEWSTEGLCFYWPWSLRTHRRKTWLKMEMTLKDEELKTVSLFISWIQLEDLVERANTYPFWLMPGELGFWDWVQITPHVLKAASMWPWCVCPCLESPAMDQPSHPSECDFLMMSPPSWTPLELHLYPGICVSTCLRVFSKIFPMIKTDLKMSSL